MAPSPIPTYADVEYVTNGHERQRLDLYIPETSPEDGDEDEEALEPPFPLIVYIHGGAFQFGSKRSDMLPYRMLDQGYAIASLDYRLSGDAIFPAAMQDCKAAVRFLRASATTYSLDTTHIVAWGESAGAHCASLLGATSHLTESEFDVGEHLDVSSAVSGVVAYYGPTDCAKMDEQAPPGSVYTHNAANSPESLYLGAPVTEIPDVVARANPIAYVNDYNDYVRGQGKGEGEGEGNRSHKPPAFFVSHGTADKMVPYGQSRILVDALRANKWDVEFLPVEGVGHLWRGISQEQQEELDETTDDFLEKVFHSSD